ncbi:MAG: isoprenylcysteine carboxylmethyltransferase family protein [Anaerolineales bacterium]|nr:isoprenylcysteine carboxylmethyltransferase family protein [Anaerolineales bacterium]
MDRISTIFLVIVLMYVVADRIAMRKAAAPRRKIKREWTVLFITIPFFLVVAASLVEYYQFKDPPNLLEMGIGSLLFAATVIVRARGYLDLGKQASVYAAEGSRKMIRSGLHRHIRHPLYLGSLLFLIACPTFLGVRFAWAATVIGLIGILIRIREEEKYLRRHVKDYKQYMQETWALIPGVF